MLRDAIGHEHQPVGSGEIPRIVSLVPSITELLCDLGLADRMVGRTGFCIHPAALVKDIPKVGGTKDVNAKKIRQLAPTHLIVNIDENEKPAVEALAEFIPHVIVTHPLEPADNLALYDLLGGIFHAEVAARRLRQAFEAEHAALLKAVAQNCRPTTTVLYCIWKDPWMTISRDTYIARMLALAGWNPWEAAPGDSPAVRYPRFEWSDAMMQDIDEVFLSSEPYRFTEEHVDMLERQIGKPVRLVDGEMLSWYGSRAIAGLRYMREIISGG